MKRRKLNDIRIKKRSVQSSQHEGHFLRRLSERKSTETHAKHARGEHPKKANTFFSRRISREGSGVLPLRRGGSHSRQYSRAAVWGAAIAAVLFLLVSIATLFEGASVVVTPRSKSMPADAVFTAVRGGEEDSFAFEVMELNDVLERDIPATEIKNVERRSTGKLTIYNDFNKKAQRLIRNTRFETPDGLIFRIYESVVVPGQSVVGGKTVPGSVAVTVHADEPGEKYNIGPTEFTIPGFKGTPRFRAFSARSTSLMKGGFVGAVKTVSEDTLKKVRGEMRQELYSRLQEKAHAEKPLDFILFEDALIVEPSPAAPVEEQDVDKSTVIVRESAKAFGILFPKDAFTSHLASKLLGDFTKDGTVTLDNAERLSFAIKNKAAFDPETDTRLTFALAGDPVFVWGFDKKAIRRSLAGQPKDKLQDIMSQFGSVLKAEVTVRPFWSRVFPENPSDIKVKSVLEE